MKILFVCKHNRFRSKVAEAVARKLDVRKRDEYKSAGVQIDILRPYVAGSVKKIMKEKGYKIIDEKARQVNDFDLAWADKIVIVADNVASDIFDGKTKAEVKVWLIRDADESELEKISKIVGEIEIRVKKLVASLNE